MSASCLNLPIQLNQLIGSPVSFMLSNDNSNNWKVSLQYLAKSLTPANFFIPSNNWLKEKSLSYKWKLLLIFFLNYILYIFITFYKVVSDIVFKLWFSKGKFPNIRRLTLLLFNLNWKSSIYKFYLKLLFWMLLNFSKLLLHQCWLDSDCYV